MCNCISEFNKKLAKLTNDEQAHILVTLFIFDEPNPTAGIKPYMSAEYQKVKKDGSQSKSISRINVLPEYCPFCGIKY